VSNTLAQNPTAQAYNNATTVAVVFASGGTNPSLYVASITIDTGITATATVADDRNGSYTPDAIGIATTHGRSMVLSVQNTSTLTATVTGTISAANYGVLKAYELTGAATSAALDTQNGAGGANSARTIGITPGTNNCTVILAGTVFGIDGGVDTNYTEAYAPNGLNNVYHIGEYRVDAGAAGAITLTYSEPDTSQHWSFAVAAYKTAGAGGGVDKGTILRRSYRPRPFGPGHPR